MTMFQEANLPDTDFRGATFDHPWFTDANLAGANFEGANIRSAPFSNSNLEGANLRNTILIHTSMDDVNLRGANLEGADVKFAQFMNSDLRGASVSGIVNLVTTAVGTPTSPKSKLGSGEITVRLEKSTRFPDNDPLKRPSLPLSLCVNVFRGLPER